MNSFSKWYAVINVKVGVVCSEKYYVLGACVSFEIHSMLENIQHVITTLHGTAEQIGMCIVIW